MATTISETCSCGAVFTAISSYGKAYFMHAVFTAKHDDCIAAKRDAVDDDHGPGGDVYSVTETARPHTVPELVTGFQRDVDWG